MARRRMIDPSIWDDEDVGLLHGDEFKIFVALWSNADDYGKIEISAARIKGLVFRFGDQSIEYCGQCLDNVVATLRSVILYTVNQRTYIKLANWNKYQTIRKPQSSIIPDAPVTHQCSTSDAPVTHQCSTSAALVTHQCSTSADEGKEGNEIDREGKGRGTREVDNTDGPVVSPDSPDSPLTLRVHSHPFAKAYLSEFTPGYMIPSPKCRDVLAKLIDLDNHPRFARVDCKKFMAYYHEKKMGSRVPDIHLVIATLQGQMNDDLEHDHAA